MKEIFLVDKPAGISSFGAVARVRRRLTEEARREWDAQYGGLSEEELRRVPARPKRVKVGHAGTLDPFATGLLIMLAGKGTKRAGEFLKLDKEYVATARLGAVSSTGDPEGEIRPFFSGDFCVSACGAPSPYEKYGSVRASTLPGTRLEKNALSGSNDNSGDFCVSASSNDNSGDFCVSACGAPSLENQGKGEPEQRTEQGMAKNPNTEYANENENPNRKNAGKNGRPNSGDEEGNGAAEQWQGKIPNKETVEKLVENWPVENLQRVPAYSAVKIQGQRAYKLARKGVAVEMPVRKVKIYELEVLEYEWPVLKFRCKVSSGTYIRALAEEIGEKLGVGAYLTELRRTQIGEFRVEQAEKLER